MEVIVVIGLTVGTFTLSSFVRLFQRGGSAAIPISDPALLRTIGIQLVLAVILGIFLAARGWRLSDMTLWPEPQDFSRGLGIWLLTYLAWIAVFVTVQTLFPGAGGRATTVYFAGRVSWPVAVLALIVDPLFEELLFLGYIIRALARWGVVVAAVISVALRVIVHLYQGPLAFLSIAPMGILYVAFYLRRRTIWPQVVAHIAQDAVAFLALHLRSL